MGGRARDLVRKPGQIYGWQGQGSGQKTWLNIWVAGPGIWSENLAKNMDCRARDLVRKPGQKYGWQGQGLKMFSVDCGKSHVFFCQQLPIIVMQGVHAGIFKDSGVCYSTSWDTHPSCNKHTGNSVLFPTIPFWIILTSDTANNACLTCNKSSEAIRTCCTFPDMYTFKSLLVTRFHLIDISNFHDMPQVEYYMALELYLHKLSLDAKKNHPYKHVD
jgi:hypothetical protein